MAASVQILCPNGRRQNVKINPNTKLLQILEEVCQRQGFIPPEDYKLVQGRKEFDLSLSVRYASIPNNAKLELVKSSSSRMEQEVTIALQLASGQRHQETFQPSSSLWDILLMFESKVSELKGVLTGVDTSQSPALHPVCIYMREEVIGEQALKAMTLKKLALTSGKAIIRHLHRPVAEGLLGEIVDKVEKEKQKQAKLEEIAQKKNELRQMDELEKNRESSRGNLTDISENQDGDQPMDVEERVQLPKANVSTPADKPRASEPESMVEDEADNSVFSTTQPGPSNQRSQRPAQSSSAIEDLRNLNIPGVEIFTPDDFRDLSPQEQAIAQRLAARFLPHLQTAVGSTQPPCPAQSASSERPELPAYQDTLPNSFENFKFPEATKGKNLQDNQESSTTLETSCDRETILYDGNESLTPHSMSQSDLPDEFFDVTQNDVRLMYRDLQNAVRRLDDQPLMTTSMRQERMEAMFDGYDRIVIRVQFPDRSILQGVFRPREPVSALYSFVQDHIENKSDKFYLYTAPPKEVLKDYMSSLAVSKLAPAAFVYYGCETQRDSYVSQDLRSNTKSRLEAETIVNRILNPEETPVPGPSNFGSGQRFPAETNPFGSHRMSGGHSSSSSPSTSSSQSSTLPSGTPVPKWLKLGKK